ncbi:MAG: DHHA1 domain-containing protein, partial [Candidatus Omnitrophota bacterium]
IFEVLDTKYSGKVILHIGRIKAGNFKKTDLIGAQVNIERRLAIARNHTATHLLQAALRKVLGNHVKQQGSLVSEDRLRFDFTHFKEISEENLARIEELVNNFVLVNHTLTTKELTLAQAKKNGALAFFGEKYGSKVRMVIVEDVSKELCGGTHLQATGQIGVFKIVQEGSIAAGTRRIEAATGTVAYKSLKNEQDLLAKVLEILNTSLDSLPAELEKKLNRIKELEKQLSAQKMDTAKNSIDTMINNAGTIKDIKVITEVLEGADMDLLRKTADMIKQKVNGTLIALGSKNQGRALLILAATLDLCDKGIDVSKMVREVAAAIGGGGGGRKDFAQGSGTNPENFDAAFNKLKEILNQ